MFYKSLFLLMVFLSTFFTLYLPYINDSPKLGLCVSLLSLTIVFIALVFGINVFSIYILFFVFVAQLIFIIHWIFIHFKMKKFAYFITISILSTITYFFSNTYIKEFFFNKKQAKNILAQHNIELNDDFKILDYKLYEFFDFSETFELKISENDFNRLSNEIKTSNHFSNYAKDKLDMEEVSNSNIDTSDYETSFAILREIKIKDNSATKYSNFKFSFLKSEQTLYYSRFD